MLGSLRRLALGLVLIAATSAVLLFSDLRSRVDPVAAAPKSGRMLRVALLQHASQAILDQGREGMMAGMSARGWVAGKNFELKYYNAEGDMPTAQAIAKEMAGGHYDLLMTISTPSLQAVANANQAGATPHVFGLVTDPYGAGVGISRENHLDHPAHLAGYGTMQPVALAFQTAREMNPALAKVGVVWNAGEANSETQVKLARKVCADLGIELLESSIENSAGVGEASAALVARGVDAIWVGGDVSVMTAIDSVIAAAQKGRIPVFTVVPPNIKRGVLFDLGADYHEVGRIVGDLAGEILSGRSPASVAVENRMPETLMLNLSATAGLKDRWTISDAMLRRATSSIDVAGVEHTVAPVAVAANPNPTGRTWKIAVVLYNETPPCEETLEGMKAAWGRSALVEGRDYTLTFRSAQGDIGALGGALDAALTERADIIVPLSTPTLQAAVQRVRNLPIVFSLVANPMAAGAGKSYTDHLPNVTGIAVLAPVASALDMLERHFPSYRRLGTLYCPAEANSVDLKESFEKLCRQRGFTLECVAANTSSDLPDAALALVSRPIDAVMQISDNLSSAGFTAIARAARQARMPLVSLNSTTAPLGSAVALGRDYHNAGEATVALIERVIAGEDPGKIPFSLPPKVVYVASPENARALGMTLPDALLKEVDRVLP